MKNLVFTPLPTPQLWGGRYTRIPGKEPAFHVGVNGKVYARWYARSDDEWLTSYMVDSPAALALGRGIQRAKQVHGGQPSGSFHINEYGAVICAIVASRDRYLVGYIKGIPRFHDPRHTGGTFTLDAAANIPPGTVWDRPYIGMCFNLDSQNRFRFTEQNEEWRRKVYCDKSDPLLVTRLRQVRPTGTIRFIVNLHGVVLTRCEPDWRTVFVGRINPDLWFPKHQPNTVSSP